MSEFEIAEDYFDRDEVEHIYRIVDGALKLEMENGFSFKIDSIAVRHQGE